MIEELREKINEIDNRMLDLLSRRAELAVSIGKEKNKIGAPVEDRGREQEILERLSCMNGGPLPDQSVERIYGVLFDETKKLQERGEEK